MTPEWPEPPTKVDEMITAAIVNAVEGAQIAINDKRLTVRQRRSLESLKVQVTCAKCPKSQPIGRLYHCLYCDKWLCQLCAEEHFGETVAEYRQRTRATEPEPVYQLPVDKFPPYA